MFESGLIQANAAFTEGGCLGKAVTAHRTQIGDGKACMKQERTRRNGYARCWRVRMKEGEDECEGCK